MIFKTREIIYILKKSEKGGVEYDILGKAIKVLESERNIKIWK